MLRIAMMILFASLPMLFQVGCKPAPAPTPPAGITRAVVTFLEHQGTPAEKYELKGAGAARVANFFVGAGQGRKSSFAGGWVAGCTVELYAESQLVSRITLDLSNTFWTEGQGDWELSPAVRQAFLTAISEASSDGQVRYLERTELTESKLRQTLN